MKKQVQIRFEGPRGSGKTTTMLLVKKQLEAVGAKIFVIDPPVNYKLSSGGVLTRRHLNNAIREADYILIDLDDPGTPALEEY